MKPITSPLYRVSWDGERFVRPFSPSFSRQRPSSQVVIAPSVLPVVATNSSHPGGRSEWAIRKAKTASDAPGAKVAEIKALTNRVLRPQVGSLASTVLIHSPEQGGIRSRIRGRSAFWVGFGVPLGIPGPG